LAIPSFYLTRLARIYPPAVHVLVVKFADATKNTVVVVETFILVGNKSNVNPTPVSENGVAHVENPLVADGIVADVVFIPPCSNDNTVLPEGLMLTSPETSQSPAVNEIDVTLAVVPLLKDIPLAELETYSPMLPACALSPAVVPTIPAVVLGVKVLVD